MSPKYLIGFLVMACVALTGEARQSRAERRLIAIKAAVMSADYRGDLAGLAALRTQASEISNDSRFGYLADYWSGFASWRIVVNGAGAKLNADDAKANLAHAVIDFESSIRKKDDFADGYASAAAVHGWLAAYNRADQAAMKQEVDIFKRDINRALELEPNNPRVLWIEAVPYLVLPPERGGNIDHAIELYRTMLENSRPPQPRSPLPDWGRAEALMSLANADIMKPSPDVDQATVEAQEALRLQPEWHFVRDILIPQIEAKRKQLAGKQ
jgi:hypothetical protein